MLRRLKRRRAQVDAGASDGGQEKNDSVLQKESRFDLRRSPRKNSKVSKVSNVQPFTMDPLPQPQPSPSAMEVDALPNSRQPATDLPDIKAEFVRSIEATGKHVEYQDRRKELLKDEREVAWDAKARKGATDIEKQAAGIVRNICEAERSGGLFGNMAAEKRPPDDSADMGGRFLMNKGRIEKSKIFKISRKVPKGAHLHLHLNSELPPEQLFVFAQKPEVRDNMFIRSNLPLTHLEAFREAEIVLSVLPSDTPTGNLFQADYNPDFKDAKNRSWMLWTDFRAAFDAAPTQEITSEEYPTFKDPDNGEETALDRAECWAREKMMITYRLKYVKATTHNQMWACFNEGTRAFKGLLNYETVFRWYIGHAIDNMVLEKVMYTELRPMLMDKTIPTNDGLRALNHSQQMTIILEEVRKKQDYLRSRNEIEKFPFGLRIIYCAPRSIPRARMQTELEDCLKLAVEFKDQGLICGFDLVGAEDRPNHIGFYADILESFQNTCEQLGLVVPFMFHAGETLLDMGGSTNPDNSNLYDSYLLKAKRIGHGYSIIKHPLLIEKYKAAGIALELCPISNELLGLCGNAREHPFPALLAAGLHCTLNADNPSLFNSSMSHEFYQVMVGDTRMSLHGWRQLAEWSIEHARLTVEEKKEGLRILRRDWEEFSQWIVDTYSGDVKV